MKPGLSENNFSDQQPQSLPTIELLAEPGQMQNLQIIPHQITNSLNL